MQHKQEVDSSSSTAAAAAVLTLVQINVLTD